MPGYFKAPDKTAEAFDGESYLCSGDAVELYDLNKPELGLIFKGRVSENFKLLSGTWVNVGELRLALIAALSPLASDIAICGHNEKSLGILIFPNVAACQEVVGKALQGQDLISNSALRTAVAERLTAFNTENPALSKRIKAAFLQATRSQ